MDDADSFSMDIKADEVPGGGLDPPIIKVYLASALTNVDEQSLAEAKRARAVIRETLQGYDYRGVRFEVYDPGEVTAPGSPHSAEEVYATDHFQTSQADLVVFYVCFPSIGVGMEAQIAADCTLPRVVVSKRDSPVSRMFNGVFSPTIASIEYGTIEELRELLLQKRLEVAEAALTSASTRRLHLEHFCQDALGAKIMRLRILQGKPLAEIAQTSDIPEWWLQRIEREPSRAPSLSVVALLRIAAALNSRASFSSTGVPTLESTDEDGQITGIMRESLNSLVAFARERDEPAKDDVVFQTWSEYREEQAALRYRSESEEPVSADEWNRRYNRHGGLLF